MNRLQRTVTDSERLASIETLVYEMHSRLLGNGQPGELAVLRKDVDRLKEWRWKVNGALGALSMSALKTVADLLPKGLFHL